MNFAAAEKIADAVLYEGYILYPYRPTSTKNRQRWNFGTLYPRDFAEAQRPAESYRLSAECLVAGGPESTLDVRVRFLTLVQRQDPREGTAKWEEGVERSADQNGLLVTDLVRDSATSNLQFNAVESPATQNVLTGELKIQAETVRTAYSNFIWSWRTSPPWRMRPPPNASVCCLSRSLRRMCCSVSKKVSSFRCWSRRTGFVPRPLDARTKACSQYWSDQKVNTTCYFALPSFSTITRR